MSFTRTRALWADNTDFLYTEAEHLDIKTAAAIDGVGGGVYALVGEIEIGGAPGVQWTFSLPVKFEDPTEFRGVVSLFADTLIGEGSGHALNVYATAEFHAPTTFDDNVVLNGDFFALGEVLLGNSSADELTVLATGYAGAPWTFDDDVTLNGTTTFNDDILAGNAQFNGDVGLGNSGSDTTTVYGGLGFSGTGKILHRTFTVTSSGNQTIQAAQYEAIYVPTGVMDTDGAYTITLGNTGIRDGMRIEIYTDDAVKGFTVLGGSIATPLKRVAGYWQTITYERVAGAWVARGAKYS